MGLFQGVLGEETLFVAQSRDQQKYPLTTWSQIDLKDMADPEYLALFEGDVNLAIILGPKSDNLVAIDFDTFEAYEVFCDANPWVRTGTLITQSARGCMIWLRMVGEYPASYTPPGKDYEWRAGGCLSTVWGLHHTGIWRSVVCQNGPATLPYSALVWPESWPPPDRKEVLQWIMARFGDPFEKGTGKKDRPSGWNQDFLAALVSMQNDIAYDIDSTSFYTYEEKTGLWVRQVDPQVCKLIGDTGRRFITESAAADTSNAATYRALHPKLTAAVENAVMHKLRGFVGHPEMFANRRRDVVHVQNCVLDFSETPWSQKGFDKAFFSRNRSPIAFDPAAKCPMFIEKLLKPQLCQDDIDLLQMWTGMALLGKNICQRALVISGLGGSGKTTLANIIQELVGRSNVGTLRTEHTDSRFEFSFYIGKTLLHASEAKATFLATEGASAIKKLTGGEVEAAEIKGGKHQINIHGIFNVLITSNNRLKVNLEGDASAWSRRILLLDFKAAPVGEKIVDFDKLLIEKEGPGILNWAIEGLQKVLEAAKLRKGFPITQEQTDRIERLISESDSVRIFVHEHIQVSPPGFNDEAITTEDLYRAYLMSCQKRGFASMEERLFRTKFSALMAEIHHLNESNNILVGENRYDKGYKNVTTKGLIL